MTWTVNLTVWSLDQSETSWRDSWGHWLRNWVRSTIRWTAMMTTQLESGSTNILLEFCLRRIISSILKSPEIVFILHKVFWTKTKCHILYWWKICQKRSLLSIWKICQKQLSNSVNMVDGCWQNLSFSDRQLVQKFNCISCDRPVDMAPSG